MKTCYDLSQLDWKLSGWIPYLWRMDDSPLACASSNAEVRSVAAKVPGSVQYSLREAGIIPDWNLGMNFRECEWVENRHWVYETTLPDEWFDSGKTYRLNCRGLDYCGSVWLNGKEVSDFCGTFVPHVFDLTPHLRESDNVLRIVFECAPRWLGQFGYTSKMKEWKTRFNYTWDWTVRLVQIGIWDNIYIETVDGREIESFRCTTDADGSNGILRVWGKAAGAKLQLTLSRDGKVLREEEIPADEFDTTISDLPVELWYPNLYGEQPLYDLSCKLLDSDGNEMDCITRRIGFRHIAWEPCEGAPKEADPWICVVNGKRVFMQGANWVPILPNFADVTKADYRKRLELYKSLGFNILRVWGGAVLERECFYDICDELGIMVWQEFPLSSSGCDNYPPDDEATIAALTPVVESYIERRQHHASLVIWCGGNELICQCSGRARPIGLSHALIARFNEIVKRDDPTRRFTPTSASGPNEWFDDSDQGKGRNWDVHGPWKAGEADLDGPWTVYWSKDDALLRSETGCPGASPARIIRWSAGKLDPMPANADNPIWSRHTNWWVECPLFVEQNGREPKDLEEYVDWSQQRQAKALCIAVKACKGRFPKCGGIFFWMGHDCFPCAANTSIIDFEGNPKPAAVAIGELFRNKI